MRTGLQAIQQHPLHSCVTCFQASRKLGETLLVLVASSYVCIVSYTFEAVMAETGCCVQGKVAACRITDSEVPHAPEPGTRSITFLTRHELRSGEVLPLPPAEVALVRPANPPGALPALHPPSKVNTPPLLFLLKPCSLQEDMFTQTASQLAAATK